MDLTGLKAALKIINEATLPELERMLDELAAKPGEDLHDILDRLDGTRITVTMEIHIPPKGSKRESEA